MLKTVILAAGKGTRMKSDLPKVVHKAAGIPMVEHVLNACVEAGVKEACVVIGYGSDVVKECVSHTKAVTEGRVSVTFAMQEEQLGTGHAVKCARDFIGKEGSTLVLCGDTPLITGKTLKKLAEHHQAAGNDTTVLSAILEDPTGYGRIIRDGEGRFVKNVEHKDATEEERASREINSGMYIFQSDKLYDALDQLNNNNAQGEYYLPDTLTIIKSQGGAVDAMVIDDVTEIEGVNSPEQLAHAEEVLKLR
ncbi:MAG: NTP transferase domain-containing protein [Lachnospiraceae bacterium]|nr:NTP transferase domain-containing protein [Lachnospiraceae bacterium]